MAPNIEPCLICGEPDDSGNLLCETCEAGRESYCDGCYDPEHDTCGMVWGCPCCEDTIDRLKERA